MTAWVDREVVGAARTDADGRFRIPGPVTGRVRVGAERYGYLVIEAGGTPDPYINADCSAACGPFDFVIVRGAVVAGRVVDDLQQPLANAPVRLDDPNDGDRALQARTDDRGRFRLPGVAAGDYELAASGPFRGLSQMGYETARAELRVEAGEERFVELTLPPAGQAYFEVSGVVTGLETAEGAARSIVLRPAGGPELGRRGRGARAAQVDAEGRFTLDRVPAGEYFARLVEGGGRGRRPGRDQTPLGRLEVHSDLQGVTLSPQPQASVSGRIAWEGGEDRRVPLLLEPLDGGAPGFLRVGPDGTFEATGLYPGRYRVRTGAGGDWVLGVRFRGRRGASGGGAYVREARVGDRVLPGAEIELGAGSLAGVTIVLSDATARLSGRIRPPAGGQPGRFRVALRGPSGVRTAQTDQNGRFELDELVPGEYEIGAWRDAGQSDVRSETWWHGAAETLRRFTVEAGAEIEIKLTAAP